MNPREERAERKSDRREAISRRVVGEIKFCSQNCLTAPWLPPFFLTSMHASYALTSVSKSDLAQAKDSRAFFASSRLSIGEVKRGFDDSRAAIVRTGISWFSLRDYLNGLTRSRLTRVQTSEDRTKNKHFSQTQVYRNSAHLRCTILATQTSEWMIIPLLTCLPRAVRRLLWSSPSTAPRS